LNLLFAPDKLIVDNLPGHCPLFLLKAFQAFIVFHLSNLQLKLVIPCGGMVYAQSSFQSFSTIFPILALLNFDDYAKPGNTTFRHSISYYPGRYGVVQWLATGISGKQCWRIRPAGRR
jgi:hypothetical protein